MSAESTVSLLDNLENRWREATKNCLIVGFHSHKGGQGRTLLCAHVAVEMLLAKTGAESDRPKRILVLDYDWSSPGLTHMLTEGVLPKTVRISRGAMTTTTEALTAFQRKIGDKELELWNLAKIQGAPPADGAEQWFETLKDLLGNLPDQLGMIELFDSAGVGVSGGPILFFMPALRASDLSNAGDIFLFQQACLGVQMFRGRMAEEMGKMHFKDPYFAWTQRAFLFYLIHALQLDFVLIDSQAALEASNWFTAGLISDLAWLPTTMFQQSLEGVGTLMQLLKASENSQNSSPFSYVPLGCELVLSSITSSQRECVANHHDDQVRCSLRPNEDVLERARKAMGLDASPLHWLPHVEELATGECFVHSLTKEGCRNEVNAYLQNIRRVVDVCDWYKGCKLCMR